MFRYIVAKLNGSALPENYVWEDIAEPGEGEEFFYHLLCRKNHQPFYLLGVFRMESGESGLSVEFDYSSEEKDFQNLLEFKLKNGVLVGDRNKHRDRTLYFLGDTYEDLASLKEKLNIGCAELVNYVVNSNLCELHKYKIMAMLNRLYHLRRKPLKYPQVLAPGLIRQRAQQFY